MIAPLPLDQLSPSSQPLLLQISAPLCFLARQSTICLFSERNSFTLITDIMGFFSVLMSSAFRPVHVFILNMRPQKAFCVKGLRVL